jgi:hypothetical protein
MIVVGHLESIQEQTNATTFNWEDQLRLLMKWSVQFYVYTTMIWESCKLNKILFYSFPIYVLYN